MGLDPHANASGAVTVAGSSVNGGLQLQFERDQGETDIDYVVEASKDLQTWSVIAQSVGGVPTAAVRAGARPVETPTAGSSRFQVTVADTPAAGGVDFLRLRIVRP